MPIIHQVQQGGQEWRQCRLGRPTASQFHRIITPKTRRPSQQQDAYVLELLAEIALGRPLDSPTTAMMARGSALEGDAADYYSFQRDANLELVGFITTDDGRVGASPDRLLGDRGLVEIKVPSEVTHMGYLLHPERGVDAEYFCQIQGQLYVSQRDWCDVISYHPELPAVIVRVERDEEFISLLSDELSRFCAQLDVGREELANRNLIHQPPPEPPEFLTEEDAEMILKGMNYAD